MSDFNYIGGASKYQTGAASYDLPYVGGNGDTLLVGIWVATGSVSGVSDNLGLDSTGSPINNWTQITTVSLGGAGQLEVWAARNAVAISKVTAVLSTTANCFMVIGEVSGLGNWKTAYSNSTTGTSLSLDETSTDDSACFLGFMIAPSHTPTTIATGHRLSEASNAGAAPDMSMMSNTITKFVMGSSSSTPLLMIGISFNIGLTFNHIPGFSDLGDTVLAAEQDALGRKIASISENAAFGMVRLECFNGYFKDGDTVPLPVSPIDGYVYGRDELIYIWGIRDTVSQTSGTGWISGADSIWYLATKVDQDTGVVSTSIAYRRSGNNWTPAVSDDGLLFIVTVAQRQMSSLILAAIPAYLETDDTRYVQDAGLEEDFLEQLNDNAKAAAVKTEVIYMGEFVNGQTVPQPVSPADGFKYQYPQVAFAFSWRWTGVGAAFAQPGQTIGQQGPMKASVSSVGAVSVSVDFIDDGGTKTTRTNYGRIAVFAICNRGRGATLTVNMTAAPYDPTLAGNAAYSWGSGSFDGTAPLKIPVKAGWSLKLSSIGTGEFSSGSGFFNANGDRTTWLTHIATDWPNHFATTSALGLLGTMCAFCDASGNVVSVAGVAQIFEIGVGPVTLTVPTGATVLQIGVIDLRTAYLDNIGTFQIILTVSTSGTNYNDFQQLDTDQFMPGNFLPASTVKQIDHNTKEAIMASEIFGPFTKANGDTVSLPVGADGYTYTRAELAYLWEWADTTNQTGSNLRQPAFYGRIDPTTGSVILQVYRLPPGGPPESDNNTLCRINVIVIAHRQRSLANVHSTDPNPPADLSSQITDNNNIFTVNGV